MKGRKITVLFVRFSFAADGNIPQSVAHRSSDWLHRMAEQEKRPQSEYLKSSGLSKRCVMVSF
jgi:hypothetical protein